jgi:beta-lactamase class C
MAVELYINGKPYAFHYGYANKETGVLVSGNSIFDIGSVTKIFTGLLLAMEINKGEMQLNAPITKYLPILPTPIKSIQQVTPEKLATHTSGLPFNMPKRIKTEPELLNYLARWHSSYIPGSQWAYSNFGIGLLGAALEYVTQTNYNLLYRTKILLPLHMNPIAFVVPLPFQGSIAQGYDGLGVGKPDKELDVLPASWAMKASANDMLRFLSAAIGLPGTPDDILSAMRLTQTPFVAAPHLQQGLGWQIHSLDQTGMYRLLHVRGSEPIGPMEIAQIPANQRHFNADRLIDKTGSWDGFRAYVAVIPARQSGIVILVNRDVSNGAMIALGRLLLLKLTQTDPTKPLIKNEFFIKKITKRKIHKKVSNKKSRLKHRKHVA